MNQFENFGKMELCLAFWDEKMANLNVSQKTKFFPFLPAQMVEK